MFLTKSLSHIFNIMIKRLTGRYNRGLFDKLPSFVIRIMHESAEFENNTRIFYNYIGVSKTRGFL